MSDSNQPNLRAEDLQNIADAAGAAEINAQHSSIDTRIFKIEERLASIEPLLEQLQANAQLGQQLTDYVGDLRSEQIYFNQARYVVGCLALLTVVGLIILLGAAVFHPASPLLKASPIAIAAFVIGMVSSIAVIVSSFIKGVFRSTAERHADGYLPPALEKAVEVLNKVAGKS